MSAKPLVLTTKGLDDYAGLRSIETPVVVLEPREAAA